MYDYIITIHISNEILVAITIQLTRLVGRTIVLKKNVPRIQHSEREKKESVAKSKKNEKKKK